MAWLMTFHCFSKSTVLFDSPSQKKTSWDWRVTQTAVLVVRSLARRFCCSRGGNGVTTAWNIYTKTSFKRRKSQSARQHFESSNLSQVLVPPSMSMFFDMAIARGQAIGTRRSFQGKRTPFWLSLRLRCAGRSSHLKVPSHGRETVLI